MSLYQRHPSTGTRARLDPWAAAAGIPAPVIEDAEKQLNGMIAGIDELIDTYPMLAEPASSDHLPHNSPSSAGSLHPRTGSASITAADRPPLSNALPALAITQLSDLLKRREISPFEVTRVVLDRIEAHDGALRTFILVTADQALAAARRAETEIAAGDYRGPLHGVPVAAKDLYDMAGVPTTAGSAILRDYVPAADSAAVAAWRAAGAVLLGKNTLHEFAFGGTSVNEHTGTPRNPWNPEHMCGGSSGGSASAVAAGFAYGAFGSETGNSVRRPAAFCGVVGLKPTYGRCSRRGVVALAWSLDHVGVFARTPSDAALLVEPLTTFDPTDPGSRRLPTPAAASLTPLEDLRGRRVGVPRALLTGIDPDVATALEGALDGLRTAGTEVLDIDLPLASRWTALASSITMQAEAAAVHECWLQDKPLAYGADVLARLLAGQALGVAEYARAQAIRSAIRAEILAVLDQVDVIAAPGTPTPAPKLQAGALVPGDAPFSTAVSPFHLQRMWSLTGLPAVSAPVGLHSNGLPMAIQLAARPWEESVILGMAHAVMSSVPSTRQAPPIAPL